MKKKKMKQQKMTMSRASGGESLGMASWQSAKTNEINGVTEK
jgi:hypothetical protein